MPLLDHPLRRPFGALLACGASSLVLMACGSSDGASTSSAASGGGAPGSANAQDTGRVRLQQCLQQNGVDVPFGPRGSGGPPSAATQQKFQAAIAGPCKKYQAGAFGNPSSAQRQEFQDAFAKFQACMHTQGVDIKAPQAGTMGFGAARQLDRDNPKVKAALGKCQDVLPRRPGAPGAGS